MLRVRYEVVTVVKMMMFWVVMLCKVVDRYQCFFGAENGGSMFLQNAGIYLQVHMALQPSRPTLISSLPQESQI
jgi:hypothetical protein